METEHKDSSKYFFTEIQYKIIVGFFGVLLILLMEYIALFFVNTVFKKSQIS